MNSLQDMLREWYGDFQSTFTKNFDPRRVSKHKAHAKQPKRDAERRAKMRRKMAKASRRINRGKS